MNKTTAADADAVPWMLVAAVTLAVHEAGRGQYVSERVSE